VCCDGGLLEEEGSSNRNGVSTKSAEKQRMEGEIAIDLEVRTM
jgi:hypothetical protein